VSNKPHPPNIYKSNLVFQHSNCILSFYSQLGGHTLRPSTTFSPVTWLLPGLLLLVVTTTGQAAEGGYSNYIPGTYGDFAMAVEPPDKLTLRNDVYYYDADDDKSVRAGRVEVGAELTFLLNLTTVLYKPDIRIGGAQYAFWCSYSFHERSRRYSLCAEDTDLEQSGQGAVWQAGFHLHRQR